jgi:hypothetical protein
VVVRELRANSLVTHPVPSGDSWQVALVGPETVPLVPTYIGDGRYSVEYNATRSGTYDLRVELLTPGQNTPTVPIRNSPFQVLFFPGK